MLVAVAARAFQSLQLRQIARRIFVEAVQTAGTTEFYLLPIVHENVRLAMSAEWLVGNEANIEWI